MCVYLFVFLRFNVRRWLAMTGSQTSVQIITTLRNAASGVLNVPSISLDDHRRRKIKMKIQKLKVEVGKKNREVDL